MLLKVVRIPTTSAPLFGFSAVAVASNEAKPTKEAGASLLVYQQFHGS